MRRIIRLLDWLNTGIDQVQNRFPTEIGKEELNMIRNYKIRIRNGGFQMLPGINSVLRKFSNLPDARHCFLRRVGTKLHSSGKQKLCSNDQEHTDTCSGYYFYHKIQEASE